MTKQQKTKPRHRLTTRVWHWTNAAALIVLFMSGLNIFNAHPRLYWGQYGFDPADAWLILERFPAWATIPGFYSLADARLWHLLFAWVLAVGLTLFFVTSLVNGHLRKDIHITRKDWRLSNIRNDVVQHLKFNFDHGISKYNFLQKFTYAFVMFILIPMIIFTGITMSPAMNASWPWLLDLFGGRQSARSLHFIAAWSLFAFFVVHVLLVLLSGPFRQMRDMITGGSAEA